VFGYITGLGGRDVTPEILKQIYQLVKQTPEPIEESGGTHLTPRPPSLEGKGERHHQYSPLRFGEGPGERC